MTTKTTAREITCYGQSNTGIWAQEWYETSTRDAARRARDLRKLGYRVTVSNMGPQVTGVGSVKMTLVSVDRGSNTCIILPPVKIHSW